MNDKLKITLIFIGSGTAMFLIFFFYPAEIFDVRLVSPVAEAEDEVSLKVFFGLDEAFKAELQETGIELKRKLSGWMIAFICFIGIPGMLAYRSWITQSKNQLEKE